MKYKLKKINLLSCLFVKCFWFDLLMLGLNVPCQIQIKVSMVLDIMGFRITNAFFKFFINDFIKWDFSKRHVKMFSYTILDFLRHLLIYMVSGCVKDDEFHIYQKEIELVFEK